MEKKTTVPFEGTQEQEMQLRQVIAEMKDEKGALMPIMQKAQDIYGYLPYEVQKIISDEMGVPMEKIYGVATFYSMFNLEPKGKYQISERYAMCSARWIQCEEMTNKLGFLSKHPTTQKPIPSPFINIGINYMNQAVRLWNEIFQIVKENCSTDYDDAAPQNDLMERLLRAREGR